MPAPSAPPNDNPEYLAFISYRHADNTEEDRQWATWLHQQLEVYDVPDDLIGTLNQRGETIPERIYPVFRDEVSLPVDADLSSAISRALDRSRFLIVLCSPRAVQSRYVNEEILHFKRSGKHDRIMAALILGEPNASIDPGKTEDPEHANTLECFPSALQYHLNDAGELDKSQATEPIAADFRLPDGGKGITNPNVYKQQLLKKGRNKADAERLTHLYEEQINTARLKIVAGLLGVPLERLTERDKIYQLNKARAATRRFRKIAVGMGSLALVALLAGGIAAYQWWRSEQLLAGLRGNLHFMNVELRDVLGKYVPQHARLNTLKRIDAIVETLQKHGGNNAEEQWEIAAALLQKADAILINYKLNPKQALPLYQEAHALFEKLVKQNPGNTQWQDGLSVSYERLADIELRLGQTDAALKHAQLALDTAQALTQQDLGNTEAQYGLAISYVKLSNIELYLGQTDAALKHAQLVLDTAQALSKQVPGNAKVQRILSAYYQLLGEIELLQGQIDAARKHFQLYQENAQALAKQDPNNTDLQRDLIASYTRLGDIQLYRQGQADAALQHYQPLLDIVQAYVKQDPGNTDFQHELSIIHDRLGDIQIRLGQTDKALQHYQLALDILQTLVKRDPGNTALQRNYYSALDHLGTVNVKLYRIEEAGRYYQTALELAQTLANKEPDVKAFQINLALTYYQVATIAEIKAERVKAVEYFKRTLDQVKLLQNRHYDLDPGYLPPVSQLEAKLKRLQKPS